MKKLMRKLLAVVAAMTMIFTMGAMPTMAEGTDGSITIQNTTKDATYAIYKVFDATYSGTNVAYSYNGDNAAFLSALQGEKSPFTVTKNTTGSYTVEKKDDATAETITTFLNGQKNNLGNAVATKNGTGSDVTFSNLGYGYYYITTTTGATVTIDTAAKDVTVIDKNESNIPTPDKKESTGSYDKTTDATAKIGDTINYEITGKIQRYQGTEAVKKLTFTDTLSNGLTRNDDLKITVQGPNDAQTKDLVKDTDYTVATNGQTITIDLPTATVDQEGKVTAFTYESGTTYTITYSAVLNENAVVATADTNAIGLKWNDTHDSGTDTTSVKSYKIDLTKTDGTKALSGAKFKLYDAKTDGNEVTVVLKSTSDDGTKVYRKAKAGETGVEMEVGTNGKLTVEGLNNGSYYFEETKAPEGYNKLTDRTDAVVINDANGSTTVVNHAGSPLPSTGGMGTTIFYVLGAALVIGAGVVLVTRRRLSK